MAIQDKFNRANVIYKITKDIDLGGGTLTIPEGCTLDFQGGSFSNGTIVGTSTNVFNASNRHIFKHSIKIGKGFNFDRLDIRWFGAVSDFDLDKQIGTDNSPIMKLVIEVSNLYKGTPIYIIGNYYFGTPILLNNSEDLNLVGEHVNNRNIFSSEAYDDVFGSPSLLYIKDNITLFTIKSEPKTSANNISINGLKILGSNSLSSTFLDYQLSGAPSRGLEVHNIEACALDTLFSISGNVDIPKDTIIYMFSLHNNHIYRCNYFLKSEIPHSEDDVTLGIGGFHIYDNVIEQGPKIKIDRLFGDLTIEHNLLEGTDNIIDIYCRSGVVNILGNYFEQNNGNVVITGHYATSIIVNIDMSFMYNSELTFKLTNLTLNKIDDKSLAHSVLSGVMFNDLDTIKKIKLSNINVEGNELHYIGYNGILDSFESYNIGNILHQINDDGSTKVSTESIVNDIPAYKLSNSLKSIGSAYIDLKFEDVVVCCLYKQTGTIKAHFYGSDGITTDTINKLTEKEFPYHGGSILIFLPINNQSFSETTINRIILYALSYEEDKISVPTFYKYDENKTLDKYCNYGNILNKKTAGIESNKPQNPSIGYVFFNTTINKPIWWTGTKWVDATGTEV